MGELKHEEGFFQARDNLRLYWQSAAPAAAAAKACVAVVHGYADHSGRYRTLMQHLAGQGFAVHAFDYRGHGQSDGRRGHCDRFEQFLDDLEIFLDRVQLAAEGKKIFLFCHSHGGLISSTFGLQRNAGMVSGVVFSAPFFRLAFKPPVAKVMAAKVLEKIIPFFPFGNEIDVAQLTRDAEIQKATTRDPLYGHLTTPRWFAEAQRAQATVLSRASEFTLPCHVMHGSGDPIADPSAAREFFDKVSAADKTFTLYDGFLHEILNEIGREKVLADVASWISARA